MSPAIREALGWVGALLVLALGGLLLGRWGNAFSFLAILTAVGVLFFFRDPPRRPACQGASWILAPADGTVVEVGATEAPFCLGKALRIAIFLSLWDVHVNRAPVSGKVVKQVRTKGRFWDARLPQAALENEHVDWLFQTERGPVVLRQIAGKIARRVVAWVGEGEGVSMGERIGMIRFGSRVELYLPLGCQPTVRLGDHVRAAETCLARWP
jgi:phosphatidylserine decarboxylase